jgi:multidrug resistance protein
MQNPAAPRRPLIIASVMAATFMIAIEATIISTAMPKIAGQLGDLHLYAWVFSGYLLTQTAMTVIFGKLADTYGRKPILMIGIAIFLVGSLLCGLAWSMPWLIVFRLLQGVGAGAIQPVCMTVVGDLYPLQERGKVQGYLASVWGLSSVLGPLAGGLIIQHLSWAWVFWINLPIGAVAMAGFFVFLREDVAVTRRQVDLVGAVLFTAAMAALMMALTQIGTGVVGNAGLAILVFAAAAAAFVWQERRASDPLVSFALWSRRPIATANAATLLSGMVVIGLTAFLPMYVQGVLGRSPLVAGFALTRMVLGTTAILLVQSSVGWRERGAATSSNIFARSLGSTLGATILGAVLNTSLAQGGSNHAAVSPEQLRSLLDAPNTLLNSPMLHLALGEALHLTFWAVFAIAVATMLLAIRVPDLVREEVTEKVAAD